MDKFNSFMIRTIVPFMTKLSNSDMSRRFVMHLCIHFRLRYEHRRYDNN